MKNTTYLVCLLLIGVLFQCSGLKSPKQKLAIDSSFIEKEDAYYFYTLGDWGRRGESGQKELAIAMGAAAEVVEPEFIISTGDNFYPNGVASVTDPQWQSSFEDIYDAQTLMCDWWVVSGNHDYRGSIEAEIAYTDVSRRWNMPARYFHKDVTTDEGVSVRFLFVDTTPLNDEYYTEEKYRTVNEEDTVAQLNWIDSMLVPSFDWKIVVGHHPLYTGGKRVDSKNYVRPHLEPLLEKHQVDLYLCGHEHDLQHIKSEDKATHHIVSGAGSDTRRTGKLPSTLFAKSIQGFLSTAITTEGLYLQFMDYNGKIIYDYDLKK